MSPAKPGKRASAETEQNAAGAGWTRGERPRWTVWFRIFLLGAAILIAGLVLWQLSHLLLLVFGAVLFAVVLRTLAAPIERWAGLSGRASVVAAALIVAAVIAAFFYVLGSEIRLQITQLVDRLPELVSSLEHWLGVVDLEGWLREQGAKILGDSSFLTNLSGFSSFIVLVLVNIFLVIAGGVYFAVQPQLYRDGLLKLVPSDWRDETASTLEAITHALRYWLLGQLVAMVAVGVVTTVGLLLLGVPSAFALGFMAALLEFVPYVGPVASAVPAIAVGLAEGGYTAVWVILLYFVIQQLEGILLMPLIQRQAVQLPPGVTIFSILAMGILFGPLGALFGAPLTVVVFVAVKKLWIRETLGEETELPGSPEED